MINITNILVDALQTFPYPISEAPMKETPSGIYACWQPNAISRKNASGVCFEESQTADIGLIVPDGVQYWEVLTQMIGLLCKHKAIHYARLTDIQYMPEIQKRCLTVRVLARQQEGDGDA